VKSSAEQIYKLQDHIRDLENDLEMSKTAQKQLKLAVIRSKKEKQAYQKFVSELLLALSQKGIARVIDGEGKQASNCCNVYKVMFIHSLYFVYVPQHPLPPLYDGFAVICLLHFVDYQTSHKRRRNCPHVICVQPYPLSK
jgi:hypothetical protein